MYISDIQSNINGRYQQYYINIVAFDRTHTIYLVFHCRGFYNVPRVLIAESKSFQALTAILDYVIQLASMLCSYRSDNKMNLRLRYCEFQNYEIMQKKKQIERTFLISGY